MRHQSDMWAGARIRGNPAAGVRVKASGLCYYTIDDAYMPRDIMHAVIGGFFMGNRL